MAPQGLDPGDLLVSGILLIDDSWMFFEVFTPRPCRGDEWSLRAFASMPRTAIFLRARAEITNFLCELASNAKIWGARASEHSFKFCEQIEQRQNFASS